MTLSDLEKWANDNEIPLLYDDFNQAIENQGRKE